MTGIVKTDQLQGAQGTTVTVPTGHTLAVTSNATVGGTLGVTSSATVGGTLGVTGATTVAGNINLPTANTFLLGAGHNVIQVDSTRTYLYGGSNGVQFRSADNSTALGAIDNLGRMTLPLQPSFQGALANTNYTTTGATVVWNTVRHNIGNHYNTSTGKFTCPTSGRYYCQIMVMSVSNMTMDIQLEINDAVTQQLTPYQQDHGGGHNQVSGAAIVNVSANDTLSFHLNAGSIYGGTGGVAGRHNSVTFHLLS